MKVEENRVVRFHYTVSEGGREVESSRGVGEPLAVLFGKGGLIPGVEKALAGRDSGDTVQAEVSPEEGYGPYRPELTQRVPKKHFKNMPLAVGQTVVMQTQQGPRPITIKKVGMSVVDIDLNHPMAGKQLSFDIEIVEVREATPEEIEHGHVHGEGGVQH
ncbi:MAG: peptidylprolyl isomerase [Xanthomonadales bacterium]|jgi:FKBP-type peptidyl-prolyl cis-trans isomerase SlyD|nr:peptidylprolyl isomerase [Xanthomonadales bacterium]